jgi:hypothetical protein
MEDPVYDQLYRELVGLEQAHPELQTVDSPSRRVGGAPAESFPSVEHRIPLQSLDNAKQGQRMQAIVMVKQGDPLATCTFQGRIAASRNVPIRVAQIQDHARIPRGKITKVFHDILPGGGIVCNAQLPMGINLGPHAFDRFDQERQGRVVGRHQHRHQRLVMPSWHLGRQLGEQILRGFMGPNPILISRALRVWQFLVQTLEHPSPTLLFQQPGQFGQSPK